MEKFRATHDILTDITIEHPRPNDVPRVSEGKPDRILVSIWLVYQAGLRFPSVRYEEGDGALPPNLHAGVRQNLLAFVIF